VEESKPVERPIWLATLFLWWRRFTYVALALFVWFSLKWVGVLSEDLYNSSVYIAAVLLFFLAMPISLILRLDHLANQMSSQSSVILLCVALLYVGLNFSVLGLIQGQLRQWRSKRKSEPDGKPSGEGPSSLNGNLH